MITFVHTADIHFGMENYGRIDHKTGIHSRLLDFHKAFNICIDKAIENNVDFFLFSGDAYKTATPSPTQQKLLFQCFLRLYKHNIPVVIIIGNHDNPLSYGKAHSLDIFNELPFDGFYVISKPSKILLNTKNGSIQIVGIPWPTRNTIAINNKHLFKNSQEIASYISKAVAQIIKKQASELDSSIPSVLAGHLTVSSGVFSGSEKRAIYGSDPILLPSDLAINPFDYVGLGHLHRYQNLNKNGYPAIVYSGSIERIDFGERKEEKGFCLVSIKEKGSTTHSFIPIATRPFLQIEVHLKPHMDHTSQILEELAQHKLDSAIIKIIYYLPDQEPDQVNISTIERACHPAWYLVGIIPIRSSISRKKRLVHSNIELNFAHLLDIYFNHKNIATENKKTCIKKALELYEQLNKQDIKQDI